MSDPGSKGIIILQVADSSVNLRARTLSGKKAGFLRVKTPPRIVQPAMKSSLPRLNSALLLLGSSLAFLLPSSAKNPLSLSEIGRIHGKIQFVTSFPDYKVQVVTSFPDLKVQKVSAFPDAPGKWQIVESFPDFKIQIVESFPDFKIQYVESFPGLP